MNILGIETSCDETAAALVQNGSRVLKNVVASQIDIHQKTGGIVPEVAAREHALKMVPVLRECVKNFDDIDAIAVTKGPGLMSALLMGITAANTLSIVLQKPLIPVHHIEGHLYANFLGRNLGDVPQFPILVLTASGGHNELILWHGHGRYTFLGETLDDAAGEAFDKVARLLGLPYPGGPVIEKMAHEGDPYRYPLPHVFLSPWDPAKNKLNFDFSFSGLKSAVNRLVAAHQSSLKTGAQKKQFVADVCASFQTSVIEVFSEKLMEAAQQNGVKEIHLTGGVSANKTLRKVIQKKIVRRFPQAARPLASKKAPQVPRPLFRFPLKMAYCTDNAAMIAAAGYYKWRTLVKKAFTGNTAVTPDPSWDIQNWKTQ